MLSTTILARDQITLERVVDINGVYRYYLVQSSTLNPPQKPTTFPPTGNWDDVEPGYTPGSTVSLYTVECTTFSNGTFEYTPVTLSSNYEAAKQAANSASAAMEAAEAASQEASSASSAVASLSLDYNQIKTEVINARGDKASLSVRIGEISSTATSANGTASTALQTANAITTEVRNATGTGSTLKQKIDGISSEVSTVSGVASSASQKADAITSEVRAATGTGSTLSQTLNGITSRVTTTEGNVSTLSTNVSGVTSRVSTAEGNISSLSTSVNGISSRVTNAEGNITSMQQTTNAIQLKVNSAIDSNNNAKGLDTSNSSGTGTSVRLTNSDISFNVPGENGDTTWDENGMYIPQINSPSVQSSFYSSSSQNGEVTRFSISDSAVVGAEQVSGFSEILNRINGMSIPSAGIEIQINKNITEQDITFKDIIGGPIKIVGPTNYGYKIHGNFYFENVKNLITMDHVFVECGKQDTETVWFYMCPNAIMTSCVVTAIQDGWVNRWASCVYSELSKVEINECELNNGRRAVMAYNIGEAILVNCKGTNNRTDYQAYYGSRIGVLGSAIPKYTSAKSAVDASSIITDTGTTTQTAGSHYTVPTTTTTVNLSPTVMRTRNDGGWLTGNRLTVGWMQGAGSHKALMVFNLSSLSGKTVQSAKLKLKRLSGVGLSGSASVTAGVSTAASASGNPTIVSASSSISLAQGSTGTITLNTSKIQDLVNGTYKSLCLANSDSSGYNGGQFSRNYQSFDVSTTIPVLTITYNG